MNINLREVSIFIISSKIKDFVVSQDEEQKEN